MVKLTLQIPEELEAQLRSHLLNRGEDLSSYVSDALRQKLFWDTVDAIRGRNANATSGEIEADAAQALKQVRAHRT